MKKCLAGTMVSVGALIWANAAVAQVAAPAPADPAPVAAPGEATPTPDAAATEGDDIVVTGFRASLASALQAKRNASNVQEVLSAEDIGKLPDNNIAESLARLPGLSTNRDRGNPTTVSIRGLPAELTNTLLNGREIVSGEATRNVRYDQYPAELISGASVYKSPLASQVEGAIAGQVDLKTVRPLDYSSRKVVLNGRAEYNDLSKKVDDAKSTGWIGSASYIDQFANDTIGVALGVARRNEPVATQRTNIYRYTNSFGDLNGDRTGNDNVPYGFEALQRGGSDKRIGALGTVQWKPGNGLEVVGDLFYSRVKYAEYQRGFSVQSLPFGNSFSDVTVQEGSATSGTAVNTDSFGLKLQNNNQYYTFTDQLYAGGLNAKYDSGRWHLVGDLGYSTVTRKALFLNQYTTATNPDGSISGVTVDWASNPGSPSSFSFDRSLTDTASNPLTNLEIPSNGSGAPIIHDELYSGRADVSYDVDSSWIQSISGGARFTSRSKDLTQRTQYGTTNTVLDSSLLLSPVTWSGEFSALPSSLSWDVLKVADQVFGGITPTQSLYDQQSSWTVDENSYAGYAQADFAHDIGSMRLTGNIGIRVIRTETTSKGTQLVQDPVTFVEVPNAVTYNNNFTDVLPALNATLHIDDRQQIRFALSKAMARAPLDYLNAGYAAYTGTPPTASGGNPLLKPYRADQADLTYEHYFNRDTAATVSLFYKKLDTFIVQQVSDLVVDGLTYQFTQPVNGTGGTIKGVELLYQQAFTFLPKPLDGFGIYANYSYTDSNVKIAEADNAIGSTPLPGLSKHVYNLALYYSKYGIDARAGYRYRSSFATQTGDTDRTLYNHGEGVLSAQIGYEFPAASPMKGLKVQLQADNLTDTPYQLYYGTTALQGRYEKFGRRFYLGATYSF